MPRRPRHARNLIGGRGPIATWGAMPKASRAGSPAPPTLDRSSWPQPWAQLKYITFQPAIFPRLLGKGSPDARPGDWVSVYDKNGEPVGAGLFNPRAKIPLRVVAHGPGPIG